MILLAKADCPSPITRPSRIYPFICLKFTRRAPLSPDLPNVSENRGEGVGGGACREPPTPPGPFFPAFGHSYAFTLSPFHCFTVFAF